MKKTLIATTLLLSSGLAFATEKSHEHDTSPSQTTMKQDKSAATDQNMPMMHENMKKMQAQMTEINKTQDPDKRDELLKTHMNSMQDMMKKMGTMQGEKTMKMGKGMNMSDENMMDMMNRQGNMENHMNMMEMMMEMIMQNQAASEETRTIRENLHKHIKR
tara:strand:- start:36903 stop:37385 length:483 start_codon:yes stop_codon:yes gene_type:complete